MLTLAGHTGAVTTLAFHPDGTQFVSGGRDKQVLLWDRAGDNRPLLHCEHGITALAFAANGTLAIGGNGDSVTIVPTLDQPGSRLQLPPRAGSVTGLAFLGDKQTLAVTTGERSFANRPGNLILFSLGTGKPRGGGRMEAAGAWGLAAHQRTIAWATGDARLFVFDLTTAEPRSLTALKRGASALAFSPDGQMLAVGDDYGIRLTAIASRTIRATLAGHKALVGALAYSPDGRTLVSGDNSGTVRFWDVTSTTPSEEARFELPVGRVHGLAFSPDRTTLAVAGETGEVLLLDCD